MRASETRSYLDYIHRFLGLVAILIPTGGCASRANPSVAPCVISGDPSELSGSAADPSSEAAFETLMRHSPGFFPYAAFVPSPKDKRAADAQLQDRAECTRLAREALARDPSMQPGKSCACDVVSATHEFVPSSDDQVHVVCGDRNLYFSGGLGLSNAYGYPLVAVCTANSPNITLHLDGAKAPTLLPEQCRKELKATCPVD